MNIKYPGFLLRQCFVSGPTWSQRFTRPSGTCRRQSEWLLEHERTFYCFLSLTLQTCQGLLMLWLSLGPARVPRKTWHPWHHWKDSECFFVCHTCEIKTLLCSTLQANYMAGPINNSCVFHLVSPGWWWRKGASGICGTKRSNSKWMTLIWDYYCHQCTVSGEMTDTASTNRVKSVPKEVPGEQDPKGSL